MGLTDFDRERQQFLDPYLQSLWPVQRDSPSLGLYDRDNSTRRTVGPRRQNHRSSTANEVALWPRADPHRRLHIAARARDAHSVVYELIPPTP